MASKRLQTSVSGLVLEYLEDIGRHPMADRRAWAGRGLGKVLDWYLENKEGDYQRWLEDRKLGEDFGD